MAKLTFDEVLRFAQELGSITRSDIPLPEGLRELSRHMDSSRLQSYSRHIAEELDKGKSLPEAMRAAPLQMPPEFIAITEAIEITGEPRAILDFTVEQSRKMQRHRAAILTALIYPVTIMAAAIGIVYFIAFTMAGRFEEVFETLRVAMPGSMQFVVNILGFLMTPPGLILGIGIISALIVAVTIERIRDKFLGQAVKLPGVTTLASLSDTAIFAKQLAHMLSRGVPLPLALKSSALTVTQQAAREALYEMSEAAEAGRPVAEHLHPGIPSTAAFLFRQGEERGDLAAACENISEYCSARFERQSARAIILLEPFLFFILGLIIMTIVFLGYIPLLQIPMAVGR